MSIAQPTNKSWSYFYQNKVKEPIWLDKEEFDQLARQEQFSDGPFIDTFGDGYGEPYNPHRQVFGKLKDGRYVYSEKESGD